MFRCSYRSESTDSDGWKLVGDEGEARSASAARRMNQLGGRDDDSKPRRWKKEKKQIMARPVSRWVRYALLRDVLYFVMNRNAFSLVRSTIVLPQGIFKIFKNPPFHKYNSRVFHGCSNIPFHSLSSERRVTEVETESRFFRWIFVVDLHSDALWKCLLTDREPREYEARYYIFDIKIQRKNWRSFLSRFLSAIIQLGFLLGVFLVQ